jgi:hypothetical protein
MSGINASFSLNFPTVSEVMRIAALEDPVSHNLQITQCYSELSHTLSRRTGPGANWCTFATWASKQAGQSIRKEDLALAMERLLQDASGAAQPAEEVARQARLMGAQRNLNEIREAARKALRLNLSLAVDRASDAVGRGNLKVFSEIGYEFARFLATFLQDAEPRPDELTNFCAALRPGEPPDGQRYLIQAFAHYYRSFFAAEAKTRAELLFLANLEIGLHEQTRLQPEIAEALDAGFVDAAQFTRLLITAIFPFSGWLTVSQWIARRLLGRATPYDRAVQATLADTRLQMRRALTESLMTIRFPPDRLIRLGTDLSGGFPEALRQPADLELCALLVQIDPTPDSLLDSGTQDWANLPDRLHFISDLFRCYQEDARLFEAPFSPEQVEVLKAGKVPQGRL